jgi:hypothetical protein
MGIIYVAKSAALGDWGNDVGLSKHLYKVGYTEEPEPVAIENWCGESDWALLSTLPAEIESEAVLFERVARKEKMIDPRHYPRLKDVPGIFKILQKHVENQMVLAKALDGEISDAIARRATRLKPVDFAAYILLLAQRG